jgi:hypothetical protein
MTVLQSFDGQLARFDRQYASPDRNGIACDRIPVIAILIQPDPEMLLGLSRGVNE